MNDRDEVVVDLERVKRDGLAVKFATLLERAEFLAACEAAGITWRNGMNATAIIHIEPKVAYRISPEGVIYGVMTGAVPNVIPYSSLICAPCHLCQCNTCAACEDCMRMGPPTDLVPGPCAHCGKGRGATPTTNCKGYITEEDLAREDAGR